MLNIVVCVKQVIDPEAPVSYFKVDPDAKKVVLSKGTPPVISPFDERALEAALRLKDSADAVVSVLSMGAALARPVLKSTLASGADAVTLIEGPAFADLDSYATATILAEGIRKLGAFDIVLCGRQASDTDAGQVGSGIAEILSLPSITVARKVDFTDGKLVVEKVIADGFEVISVGLPALITVGSEHPKLREPGIQAMMAANKKPVVVWSESDLGLDPTSLKKGNLVALSQPVRESHCEIIGGATPEDVGVQLAVRLRESKVI
jgi:electron transfer flavoprotein beta subunit